MDKSSLQQNANVQGRETLRASRFCIIEVDDFELWRNFIVQQLRSADEKYIHDGSEFGGKERWVYRGQADASWPITSSLERLFAPVRGKILCQERALRGRERDSILEFKKRAWRYLDDPSMNYLEWLTLMRHHGVPTRLVDFSESALIALYFALEPDSTTEFAIWALDRESLINPLQQSCVGKKLPGFDQLRAKYGGDFWGKVTDPKCLDPILNKPREFIANFQHSFTTAVLASEINRKIALEILEAPLDQSQDVAGNVPLVDFYPERPSARMLAQKGLFLMSTELSRPFMDALYTSIGQKNSDEIPSVKISEIATSKSQVYNSGLIKFVFNRSMEDEAREMLRIANLGRDVVYPDIEGVADSVSCRIKKSFAGYIDVDELKAVGGLSAKEIESKMKINRSSMLKVWG